MLFFDLAFFTMWCQVPTAAAAAVSKRAPAMLMAMMRPGLRVAPPVVGGDCVMEAWWVGGMVDERGVLIV